jgi:GT2 family glycosyltransferase
VRLTAIVPATDAPPTLARCLRAIQEADEPPEEVIAIDHPSRAGPAEARNLGASRASGQVLVFVDADVVVHADTFTRIRRALENDPGLDAVFGSYDDRPEAAGTVSVFRNLLHYHVHQEGAGRASTFWAGLGAVRREPFHAVGGFDEVRYPSPSIEDVELGMRLAAAGSRIELDPALRGTHLKGWTLAEMVETDFASRGVPWVELLLERRQATRVLNLGWRHRASAAASVVAVAAAASGRPRLAWGSLGALVVLNRSFYGLLGRYGGPVLAAVGVGLHAVHHLTGVASVPAGLLRRRCSKRR